ncbi:MAG: hypothetical protein ACM3O9_02820 [Methylocystaceae bacterium]
MLKKPLMVLMVAMMLTVGLTSVALAVFYDSWSLRVSSSDSDYTSDYSLYPGKGVDVYNSTSGRSIVVRAVRADNGYVLTSWKTISSGSQSRVYTNPSSSLEYKDVKIEVKSTTSGYITATGMNAWEEYDD